MKDFEVISLTIITRAKFKVLHMNPTIGFALIEEYNPSRYILRAVPPRPIRNGSREEGLELFRGWHLMSPNIYGTNLFIAVANNTPQKWIYLWSLEKQQFVQIWHVPSEKVTFLSAPRWCCNNEFAFVLVNRNAIEEGEFSECLVYHVNCPSLWTTLRFDPYCYTLAVKEQILLTGHIVKKAGVPTIKKWDLQPLYRQLVR